MFRIPPTIRRLKTAFGHQTGLALLSLLMCACADNSPSAPDASNADRQLEIFAGSASEPALEEAARSFEQLSGANLRLHLGGSGAMLSQLLLGGIGDLYLPGSSDYMELAKQRNLVLADTVAPIAYLIPAILVSPGNPKQIKDLADLGREGLRVGIARPDTVCVGLYAAELLEHMQLSPVVRKNIVTHAESCAKTAQLIALGHVDAVIGWRVFAHWQPDAIEAISLPVDAVARVGVIPAAVVLGSPQPELAKRFIEFLQSKTGREIFRKHGYITSEGEARRSALASTPLGGQWTLPDSWQP